MAAILAGIATIVGVSLAPLFGAATEPTKISCTEGVVATFEFRRPGSVILTCPTTYTTWKPSLQSDKVMSVGTSPDCATEMPLGALCPGATGSTATGSATTLGSEASPPSLIFNVPQLPASTTTLYITCYPKSESSRKNDQTAKGCGFALTVKGYTPEGPQACSNLGSTVQLAIPGEGGRTQFMCGTGLVLSPSDPKKAYESDCTKEKNLKDLELTKGSDGYLTLLATKKPSNQRLCYLCSSATPPSKGQGTNNCAILIDVSAGSGLAARSTVGLALSCALALLHVV